MFKKISIFSYFLLVIFAIFGTLAHHYTLNKLVLPYFDGSHHFSEFMNLANSINLDPIPTLKAFWIKSPDYFFLYSIISFIANATTHNRMIFPSLYIVLLLSVLLSIFFLYYKKSENWYQKFITTSFFVLLSNIYVSSNGGMLDNRLDIFSITILTISILAALDKKYYCSLLLLTIAWFAKAASFFLSLPFLALLFFFILGDLKKQFKLISLLKMIIPLSGLVIFLLSILSSAASYNLMSTGGNTLSNKLTLFFTNYYTYITSDFFFYLKLLLIKPLFWIPLITIIFNALLLRKKPNKLELGFLIFFVWTFFLLTSNPLHSEPLLIWFFPAFIVGVVAFSDFYSKVQNKKRALDLILIIIFLSQLYPMIKNNLFVFNEPRWKTEYFTSTKNNIETQAKEIATYINSQKETKVAILVNFLCDEWPLSHTYDTYRVLIHERLKPYNKIILGWELSTRGPDWLIEMKTFLTENRVYLILQEDPSQLPAVNNPQIYGKKIYDTFIRFSKQKPECFTTIANDIQVPKIGTRKVFGYNNTENCLVALTNFATE